MFLFLFSLPSPRYPESSLLSAGTNILISSLIGNVQLELADVKRSHDAAVAERDALRIERDTVTEERDNLSTQISSLVSQHASLSTQLGQVRSQCAALQQQYQDAQQAITKAREEGQNGERERFRTQRQTARDEISQNKRKVAKLQDELQKERDGNHAHLREHYEKEMEKSKQETESELNGLRWELAQRDDATDRNGFARNQELADQMADLQEARNRLHAEAERLRPEYESRLFDALEKQRLEYEKKENLLVQEIDKTVEERVGQELRYREKYPSSLGELSLEKNKAHYEAELNQITDSHAAEMLELHGTIAALEAKLKERSDAKDMEILQRNGDAQMQDVSDTQIQEQLNAERHQMQEEMNAKMLGLVECEKQAIYSQYDTDVQSRCDARMSAQGEVIRDQVKAEYNTLHQQELDAHIAKAREEYSAKSQSMQSEHESLRERIRTQNDQHSAEVKGLQDELNAMKSNWDSAVHREDLKYQAAFMRMKAKSKRDKKQYKITLNNSSVGRSKLEKERAENAEQLVVARSEIEKANDIERNLQHKNTELQEELKNLRLRSHELEEDAEQSAKQAKLDIEAMKDELHTVDNARADLQHKVRQSDEAVTKARESVEEIGHLQRIIEERDQQLMDHAESEATQKKDLTQLKEDNHELQREVKLLRHLKATLKKDVEEARDNYQVLKSDYDEMEQEYYAIQNGHSNSLAKQQQAHEHEYAILQSTKDTEIATWKQAVSKSEQKATSLQNELDEADETLKRAFFEDKEECLSPGSRNTINANIQLAEREMREAHREYDNAIGDREKRIRELERINRQGEAETGVLRKRVEALEAPEEKPTRLASKTPAPAYSSRGAQTGSMEPPQQLLGLSSIRMQASVPKHASQSLMLAPTKTMASMGPSSKSWSAMYVLLTLLMLLGLKLLVSQAGHNPHGTRYGFDRELGLMDGGFWWWSVFE